MDMTPSRAQMDQNSGHDQSGAEAKGQSGRLRGEGRVYQLNLLKEKTEARHDEAKTHQRETGTNPGEKGTLRGKVITKVGSGRHRGIIRRSRGPLAGPSFGHLITTFHKSATERSHTA